MTHQHTVPFHIFKDEIARQVIAASAYAGAEWFDGQTARLAFYHNYGETIEGASALMIEFGRGEIENRRLGSLTPLAMARKYGRGVRLP